MNIQQHQIDKLIDRIAELETDLQRTATLLGETMRGKAEAEDRATRERARRRRAEAELQLAQDLDRARGRELAEIDKALSEALPGAGGMPRVDLAKEAARQLIESAKQAGGPMPGIDRPSTEERLADIEAVILNLAQATFGDKSAAISDMNFFGDLADYILGPRP